MKILYYVADETPEGWIMLGQAYGDRHSALLELYKLRPEHPRAAICEEPYCMEMGVTFGSTAVN